MDDAEQYGKDMIESRLRAESYLTAANAVSILSSICWADGDKIVDELTGYLWDEEEAAKIKRILSKFEVDDEVEPVR